MEPNLHICDVCKLLDNDNQPKACTYCKACDAWLCDRDKGDWMRRTAAAAKRVLGGS